MMPLDKSPLKVDTFIQNNVEKIIHNKSPVYRDTVARQE